MTSSVKIQTVSSVPYTEHHRRTKENLKFCVSFELGLVKESSRKLDHRFSFVVFRPMPSRNCQVQPIQDLLCTQQ
jgi:hypothetical protein